MANKLLGFVLYAPFLGYINKGRPYTFQGERFIGSVNIHDKDFLDNVRIYKTQETAIKGRKCLYQAASNVDKLIIKKLYDDLTTEDIA